MTKELTRIDVLRGDHCDDDVLALIAERDDLRATLAKSMANRITEKAEQAAVLRERDAAVAREAVLREALKWAVEDDDPAVCPYCRGMPFIGLPGPGVGKCVAHGALAQPSPAAEALLGERREALALLRRFVDAADFSPRAFERVAVDARALLAKTEGRR